MIKQLIRRVVPRGAVKVIENVYRTARGMFWQTRHGFPARGMRVIAITGTNGKSTTASYVNEILKAAGYKTAVLTTVYYEIDGGRQSNKTHYTIDKQSIVQSFFANARRAGVDFVVLEVTSHALDQGRIMGVPVEIAVITNLTQDHLDYHGDMDEYARVKSRLLSNYGAKWAVLNADDGWYDYFLHQSAAKVYSFGKKTGVVARIQNVKVTDKGSDAKLATEATKLPIKTSLIGEFNVYNAAAAASVGFILEIKAKTVQQGITNLKFVSGRMEPVDVGQKFKVLVDFAITPDALEKALISLKKIAKGKVRVVFGATGDRDKSKRPLMGTVAAENADFIYLTDDETYTEDPETIRQAVYAGIKAVNAEGKTQIIPDRKKAIKQAFKDAKRGDIVLLTGIGHEDSRNMGGKQIPWNERQVAVKLLKSI